MAVSLWYVTCREMTQNMTLSVLSSCSRLLPGNAMNGKPKSRTAEKEKVVPTVPSNLTTGTVTLESVLSLVSTITKLEWSKGQFGYIQTLDTHLKHRISLIFPIYKRYGCAYGCQIYGFECKKLGSNFHVREKVARLIFY